MWWPTPFGLSRVDLPKYLITQWFNPNHSAKYVIPRWLSFKDACRAGLTSSMNMISSTRTRRGGSCLGFGYKTFIIYITLMHRAPARPVRACVLCANLLHGCCPRTSKNMTCARPHGKTTPSEHFLHTSHCTLHTPHFMLHTCTSHSTLHLISNNIWFLLASCHLISALLISSHPFSHVI